MNGLEFLQNYWWLIISLVGAILVFMLFVQGGQTFLFCKSLAPYTDLITASIGRKWELTYTTLVLFGGAFFASFPLFYSTSFGGAYWLWMAILLSFVIQAVSYEYRRKKGNIYGARFYETLLLLNGLLGCTLLGVAVGTMFFGADFTVSKSNLLDPGQPVISQWGPLHGLEAIADWRCLLLGVTILFLARTLGALYLQNNVRSDHKFASTISKAILVNGLIFAVLFVAFVIVLLAQRPIYLTNLTTLWWFGFLFVLGVILALLGIYTGAFTKSKAGIWWSGTGTVLVVLSLLAASGLNGNSYLPSITDPASSLTIANSSSSEYTLRTMAWVSIAIPFVVAYITYVWSKMNQRGITKQDIH